MKGKTNVFPKEKPFKSSEFHYLDSKNKYEDYLLNKIHPEDKFKAEFIEQNLGYKQGDSEIFHKAICEAIDGKIPNETESTKYGTKEKFETKIRGKDGNFHNTNLVIVVQKDNGKTTWRLITIKPGKKDK